MPHAPDPPGPDRGAAAGGPRAVETPPDGPIRVLVAEDSLVNQLIARAMLERAGCVVETAGDGNAAVAAALRRPFDVILMDLSMPGRNGIEAARAIRAAEAGRRTPIVALTAHAMPEHRARCLAADMDDHLAKPFDPDALIAMVARWARRPLGPARTLATG